MNQFVAIIDLGSNSIRMNIVNIGETGGYSIFDQASEMVRLSEGLLEDLYLKELPMERTIEALRYFQKLIEVYRVKKVYALATAAVRMAKNGKAFIKRIDVELGLKFTVLTGLEEAYYDYLGVVNSIELKDALIMDIGGGSTELILMKNRNLVASVSLPFGSVTLSEQFKDGKKKFQQAERYISKAFQSLEWFEEAQGYPLIGLGGVIRMIGKMDRAIENHAISNMHNYKLTKNELDRAIKLIFETTIDDLPKLPGMSKRRADIAHLGVLPLHVASKMLKSSEIRISGNGLREGYFYSVYLPSVYEATVVPDVLVHSRTNLMKRYAINIEHAEHVKKLALELFAGLNTLGNWGAQDRVILENAALLHDIGMHIEYYNHHIHGFYLILNGRLDGMTNLERLSVAYLVGSHRVSGIKSKMEDFESLLDKKELVRLEKLSILLMLTEQLDRSETQKIENIFVREMDGEVVLSIKTEMNCSLEIASALRLSDKFEKGFNRKIRIEYFA